MCVLEWILLFLFFRLIPFQLEIPSVFLFSIRFVLEREKSVVISAAAAVPRVSRRLLVSFLLYYSLPSGIDSFAYESFRYSRFVPEHSRYAS